MVRYDDTQEVRRELKRIEAEIRWLAEHARSLTWRERLALWAAAGFCATPKGVHNE